MGLIGDLEKAREAAQNGDSERTLELLNLIRERSKNAAEGEEEIRESGMAVFNQRLDAVEDCLPDETAKAAERIGSFAEELRTARRQHEGTSEEG